MTNVIHILTSSTPIIDQHPFITSPEPSPTVNRALHVSLSSTPLPSSAQVSLPTTSTSSNQGLCEKVRGIMVRLGFTPIMIGEYNETDLLALAKDKSDSDLYKTLAKIKKSRNLAEKVFLQACLRKPSTELNAILRSMPIGQAKQQLIALELDRVRNVMVRAGLSKEKIAMYSRDELALLATSYTTDEDLYKYVISTKASYTIQRAWRNAHVGIAHLKQDHAVLADLSHEKFKLYCATRLPKVIRTTTAVPKLKITAEALSIARSRHEFQTNLVPVCTGLGVDGSLPTYSLVPKSNLREHIRLPDGTLYLTPEIYAAHIARKPTPLKTKEELDLFVQRLATTKDFIAWDYTRDGCFARADMVIDLLTLSGIPQANMKKQYIIHKPKPGAVAWRYHVAPVLQLSDGSSWVIDPALDPTKALSLEEWIAKEATSRYGSSEHVSVEGGIASYFSGKDNLTHIIDENGKDCHLMALGRFRHNLEKEHIIHAFSKAKSIN